MESPKSPTGSARRHARNISHLMVRRSTRGPLDEADDPLQEHASTPQSPSVASSSPSLDVPAAQSRQAQPALAATIDVRFLHDPSLYHSLGTEDISPFFWESPNQPPPGTALSDLLQQGHFRRAAITAAYELVQGGAKDDITHTLRLLYTRLSCLVLLQRPDLASHEAAPLTDVLTRNPPLAKDLLPYIPWELRLLLVRLQSIGATDGGRRGIMALYSLASEVRGDIKAARRANNGPTLEVLQGRLQDLGLRVADAFVEMGELETATRHLDSLDNIDMDILNHRKALLRLRVGDVVGARACAEAMSSQDNHQGSMNALIQAAEGRSTSSLEAYQALLQEQPDDAAVSNNLAVMLLYTGQISQAREVLESMSEQQPAFPSLLFNLSTIYELAAENAVPLKETLLQRASAKAPQFHSGGWERSNIEVKL